MCQLCSVFMIFIVHIFIGQTENSRPLEFKLARYKFSSLFHFSLSIMSAQRPCHACQESRIEVFIFR
jgi:hypothetical protein